jgi:hypothetical protein
MRNESNEDVYYGDGSVWVTSRRLIYGGEEQSLRGVRSARVRIIRVGDTLLSFYLEILLLVPVGVLFWFRLSPSDPDDLLMGGLANLAHDFIIGVAIILIAVLIAQPFIIASISNDPVYTAWVRYRFRSTTVAVSRDRAYIERIVDVIQYAVARRDKPATAITAPEAIGHSFQIPAPFVVGNTLHVGQMVYGLAEVGSIKVAGVTGFTWFLYLLPGGLLLQQVFAYVAENVKGLGILNLILGFVFPLLIICCTVISTTEFLRIKYTLQLTTTKGVVSTIYATMDQANAKQMRQSIQQAMQGTYAVEHA